MCERKGKSRVAAQGDKTDSTNNYLFSSYKNTTITPHVITIVREQTQCWMGWENE